MARRRRSPSSNDGLRAWLLAEAVEFRTALTTRTVVEPGGARIVRETEHSAVRAAIWRELSGPVEALSAGEACALHRYQLPDNHPAAQHYAGSPSDVLELGVDDVLRLVVD